MSYRTHRTHRFAMLSTLILSVLATCAAVSLEANRPYLDMWNAYVNNTAAAAKYGLQERMHAFVPQKT